MNRLAQLSLVLLLVACGASPESSYLAGKTQLERNLARAAQIQDVPDANG